MRENLVIYTGHISIGFPPMIDWICSLDGENKNAYRIWVGKSLEKQTLEEPSWIWGDNIMLHLKKTECEYGGECKWL